MLRDKNLCIMQTNNITLLSLLTWITNGSASTSLKKTKTRIQRPAGPTMQLVQKQTTRTTSAIYNFEWNPSQLKNWACWQGYTYNLQIFRSSRDDINQKCHLTILSPSAEKKKTKKEQAGTARNEIMRVMQVDWNSNGPVQVRTNKRHRIVLCFQL